MPVPAISRGCRSRVAADCARGNRPLGRTQRARRVRGQHRFGDIASTAATEDPRYVRALDLQERGIIAQRCTQNAGQHPCPERSAGFAGENGGGHKIFPVRPRRAADSCRVRIVSALVGAPLDARGPAWNREVATRPDRDQISGPAFTRRVGRGRRREYKARPAEGCAARLKRGGSQKMLRMAADGVGGPSGARRTPQRPAGIRPGHHGQHRAAHPPGTAEACGRFSSAIMPSTSWSHCAPASISPISSMLSRARPWGAQPPLVQRANRSRFHQGSSRSCESRSTAAPTLRRGRASACRIAAAGAGIHAPGRAGLDHQARFGSCRISRPDSRIFLQIAARQARAPHRPAPAAQRRSAR